MAGFAETLTRVVSRSGLPEWSQVSLRLVSRRRSDSCLHKQGNLVAVKRRVVVEYKTI
jgi:hypothetical protein